MKDETIADFLARGGRITKAPTAEANATPLRVLRKQADRNADAGLGYRVLSAEERSIEAEHRAERRAEIFGAARLNGASESDALDEANGL